MRDPNRIDVILKKIETIWKAVPDQRLMQLLLNAIGTYAVVPDHIFEDSVVIDHYNTEDDVVLDKLEKLYKDKLNLIEE